MGMHKAVKPQFGGGMRRFSCDEDNIYDNIESELCFFTSQVRGCNCGLLCIFGGLSHRFLFFFNYWATCQWVLLRHCCMQNHLHSLTVVEYWSDDYFEEIFAMCVSVYHHLVYPPCTSCDLCVSDIWYEAVVLKLQFWVITSDDCRISAENQQFKFSEILANYSQIKWVSSRIFFS